MKITILGCEGPFPSAMGATSGYLMQTQNGDICFDMGSGAFAALRTKEKPERVNCVLLSHLHYDHTSDMGVYNYYLENLSRRGLFEGKLRCFLPPVSDGEAASFAERYPYFEFVRLKEKKKYEICNLDFTFYAMRHPVVTFGFTAKEGNKTFAYTADTNVCENLYAMAEEADLMIADGLFLEKNYGENAPHLSVKIIAALAEKYGFRAVVSHLSPNTPRGEYLAEAGGLAEVAERFREYEL